MKNRLAVLSLVWGSLLVAVAPVDGIVRLCEAGMSEDIIVMAAKQSPSANLTVEQMLAVKKACGENVLRALMARPPAVTANPATPAVSSSGVYLVSGGKRVSIPTAKLRRAGYKLGFGGLMSAAKASPKMMGELDGSRAEVRTTGQPEFVLSGAEYLLVRLETKGDKRQAVVGKGGLMGSRGGFEEKNLIRFSIDKSNGHVTINRPLEAGEYMFYPRDAFEAAGETTLNLTGKAYPFGVD